MKVNKNISKGFLSLKYKVLILVLIVAIIPLILMGTLLQQKINKNTIEIKQKNIESSLENISYELSTVVDYAQDLSLMLIQDENVRSLLLTDYNTNQALQMHHKGKIGKLLSFYIGQKDYISSVGISGWNAEKIIGGTVYTEDVTRELLEEIKQKKGGEIWKLEENDGKNKKESTITLFRDLRDINNVKNSLGTIWIGISDRKISSIFDKFLEDTSEGAIIVDSQGEMLFSRTSNDEKEAYIVEKVSELGMKNGISEFKGKDGEKEYLYYHTIPNTGWMLAMLITKSQMLGEIISLQVPTIIAMFASLILCIIIAILFSHKIIYPLKILTEKIAGIKRDNFEGRLDIKSNDEIGILNNQFNIMISRLNSLIEEVTMVKMKENDAQLKALQAQVDPHFLYNNLDMAYWMSRLEKADRTGEILLALSEMYRVSVNAEKKLIPVERELLYTEKYLLIQRIRLEDKVVINLDVEPETLQLSTIQFALQPLIENSIEHGILPTGKIGEINIKVYLQYGILYFDIQDSGIGVDFEEIESLLLDKESTERKGMAIRNINQRIQLQFVTQYGSGFGVEFLETGCEGTLVRVAQPAIIMQ